MLNHKCPRDAQYQIGWLIFGTPCLSIVVSLRALFCLLLPQSLESTLITIQTRAGDFTLYSLIRFPAKANFRKFTLPSTPNAIIRFAVDIRLGYSK